MKAAKTIYLHGFSGDARGLSELAHTMSPTPYELYQLPGFGGKAIPAGCRGIISYSEVVAQEIFASHDRPINLVGHSQGAMIAYCIAAKYPERIKRLTLLNPVARPRAVTRLVSRQITALSYILPEKVLTYLLSRPLLVNLVSRYMTRPLTTAERKKIYTLRLRETQHYNKSMIRLSKHALEFTKCMDNATVAVPTVICYAPDDSIASASDISWYRARISEVQTTALEGGHLSVLAKPELVRQKLEGITT